MEARLYSDRDIVENGRKAERFERELRGKAPEVLNHPEIKNIIDLNKERARRAMDLKSVAGGREVKFAEINGPSPVLGWVKSEGHSPIHVHFDLLDGDQSLARRVTSHETTHMKTPRKLKIDESWRHSLTPLFDALGLPEESYEQSLDTPFIEGYVEEKTIQRYGADKNIAYTNREVPFVKKLERLGLEELGISFRELFFSWQIDAFKENLLLLMIKLETKNAA